MKMMGQEHRQSLMIISTTGVLFCAKASPLYNALWECPVAVYVFLQTVGVATACWVIGP